MTDHSNRFAKLARRTSLSLGLGAILGIGAVATDYFVPQDHPRSDRRDS